MSSSLHMLGEHGWADKRVHSNKVFCLHAPCGTGAMYYTQKSVLSSNVVIQLVSKVVSHKAI